MKAANMEFPTSSVRSMASLLMLLALLAFVSISHNVNRFIAPMLSKSTSRPLLISSYSSGIEQSKATTTRTTRTNRSTTLPNAKPMQTKQQSTSATDLPIYLLQSATNETAQIPWGTIAKSWNRTAQYTDLWDLATPISRLPKDGNIMSMASNNNSNSPRRRPAVMIHCGPKTGSTTLRKACRFNLEDTCGIDRKVSGHYPVGYQDESELYPLIRKCTNTHHFCAKEVIMPTDETIVPSFDNVLFLHMFPFRNYNEWAASALKQAYDRGREVGCDRAKVLLDECQPSRMEIDFRKYGKTELSKFKEGVVHRINNGMKEEHVFILYHHRELNNVLDTLSELYEIPTLPGSDGKGKLVRPKGMCEGEEEMLQMFHDCFSEELMELK